MPIFKIFGQRWLLACRLLSCFALLVIHSIQAEPLWLWPKSDHLRFSAHPPVIDLPLSTPPFEVAFPTETRCFLVKKITLTGQDALPFWIPLQDKADIALGNCLGINGINLLISSLQNYLISYGWVTTRIVAPEQNLLHGELQLQVVAGKVRAIRYSDESNRSASLSYAIPLRSGQLFDLRAIEQGLENLQRIPNVTASMQLLSSDIKDESDIVITRQQQRFWHMATWFQNSTTHQPQRSQLGMMFALDNPLRLSDLFYLSLGRAFPLTEKLTAPEYTLHYSVPFGYSEWALTANRFDFSHQTLNHQDALLRHGSSRFIDLALKRTLYRNGKNKTALMTGIKFASTHYAALPAQQHTTEWRIAVKHQQQIKQLYFNTQLSYRRTNHGSMRTIGNPLANQRQWQRSTDIYQFAASVRAPFQWLNQQWSYQSDYFLQVTPDQLSPLQQLHLGGVTSIRGFDGKQQLIANQGWYLRNTLSWQLPLPEQQLYLAIDYGKSRGSTHATYSEKSLSGAALGWRGTLSHTELSYDVALGSPLVKPPHFKADKVQLSLALNWQY